MNPFNYADEKKKSLLIVLGNCTQRYSRDVGQVREYSRQLLRYVPVRPAS